MTYDELHVIYPRWHLSRARLLRELREGKLELDVAWNKLQAIAAAYQRANKIMFLGLPIVETDAMIEWLRNLTNMYED